MKSDYQKPDFEMETLGNLSRDQLIDRIREQDWTSDLMKFASLFTTNKEACPPNINAQIDEQTTVTIVPANVGRFTVIAGKSTGPKWLRLGTDILIEDVDLQEVESILADLEQGLFAELKRKYSN